MDGIKNIDNKFMIERASFKDSTKPSTPVEQGGVRKESHGFFDVSNNNLSAQQTESMLRNIKNIAAMAIDPTSDVSDLTEGQITEELKKARNDLISVRTGMEIDAIKNRFLNTQAEKKICDIGGALKSNYDSFLALASDRKKEIDGKTAKGSNLATIFDRVWATY
jgi:hypothetical protein